MSVVRSLDAKFQNTSHQENQPFLRNNSNSRDEQIQILEEKILNLQKLNLEQKNQFEQVVREKEQRLFEVETKYFQLTKRNQGTPRIVAEKFDDQQVSVHKDPENSLKELKLQIKEPEEEKKLLQSQLEERNARSCSNPNFLGVGPFDSKDERNWESHQNSFREFEDKLKSYEADLTKAKACFLTIDTT